MPTFPSYTFTATGATNPRTLPVRLNDTFNVKDFGAKGDGATDDTAAINDTIDYAYTLGSAGFGQGGIIFFPSGIYKITTQLTLDRKPTIHLAALMFHGCGRDASILRGTYSTGIQMGGGFTVTNVVSGTGGVDRVTLGGIANPASLLSVGQPVTITGVVGVPNINAQWDISAIDPSFQWIELSTSVFAGSYSSGGRVYYTSVPPTYQDGSGGVPPNGFMVVANYWQTQVLEMRDLGIENLSTDATSGAFMSQSGPIHVENCRFKGVLSFYSQVLDFGGRVRNCIFECSRPITAASDATLSPNFALSNFSNLPGDCNGSVGAFFAQGAYYDCQATGFDVGFVLDGVYQIVNLKASRCGVGILNGYLGGCTAGGGNVGGSASGIPVTSGFDANSKGQFLGGCSVDRCTIGMLFSGTQAVVASNNITGNTGPHDPAVIDSITWGGGTATATTHVAHNLPTGASNLVLVTNTSDWTPGGTGNEIVSCTKLNATQFTYLLGAAGTGTGSGTWNYALQYGIQVRFAPQVAFLANNLAATVSQESFEYSTLVPAVITGQTTIISTPGPNGWSFGSPTVTYGGVKFIQCYSTTNSPRPLVFSELPPLSPAPIPENQWLYDSMVGDSFNISDGQKSGGGAAAFADVVAGSSSGHYKVSWNGTDWIRTG